MPGIHKNRTLSFRPSDWERNIIEEKAAMSGWAKKDFIARSCIYSSICVVGNKKNIQRIVDSLEEVRNVMVEISSRITTGDFPMSEDDFEVMAKRYLALCSAIVDIADGASYLFGVDNPKPSSVFEKQEHLKQLLESIDIKP